MQHVCITDMFKQLNKWLLQSWMEPLFSRPDRVLVWWQVILWWEIRRIAYNVIIGATGIAGLFIIAGMLEGRDLGSGDLGDPFLGIIFYGFTANVCYTGGWIVEFVASLVEGKERAAKLGVFFFKLGLLFSLFVTLILPTVLILRALFSS